jgi:hypothetical protein
MGEQRARRGIVHDDAGKSVQTQEILRYCIVNPRSQQERRQSSEAVLAIE